MSEKMRVFYAAQPQIVIDTLTRNGVYKVKRAFIDKKYASVAPVMHQAYTWFSKALAEAVDKPEGCDYPVWLYQEPGYAVVDDSQILLKLSIPESELITFDNHGWERVLSMSYVGSNVTEEIAYDDSLRNMGIQGGYVVFQQPFYPIQKQEIIKSWHNIFALTDESVVRAAVWQLKEEWLID